MSGWYLDPKSISVYKKRSLFFTNLKNLQTLHYLNPPVLSFKLRPNDRRHRTANALYISGKHIPEMHLVKKTGQVKYFNYYLSHLVKVSNLCVREKNTIFRDN